MEVVGYARVGTGEQALTIQNQNDALSAYGCQRLYADVTDGARCARPGLDALLAECRPGDRVVVTRIDRLGRSPVDTLRTMAALDAHDLVIEALDVGLDTGKPTGKKALTALIAVAHWERDLIALRAQLGVAKARAEGRLPGRKAILSIDQQAMVREMHANHPRGNGSVARLADAFGVSQMTIRRVLERAGSTGQLDAKGSCHG